ncbi:transglycosylase SLT domain-containing protein [Candidatus Daviesbacteria bacterium]|nr:transglycosylase SLT domain-containing protein [Candidatus Daviesbacteria bacterium]
MERKTAQSILLTLGLFVGSSFIRPSNVGAAVNDSTVQDKESWIEPWECNMEERECTENHVKAAIKFAANQYGVSQSLLECIAQHESNFNPYKVSKTNDHGAFQFHLNSADKYHPTAWTMMDITPYKGQSFYDPFASANATAYLIANGITTPETGGWTTYRLCTRD